MKLRSKQVQMAGSIEAVNKYFLEQNWGDGLPVVPPTERRVRKLIEGAGLPADEIVGYVPPLNGKATVEKIAINAVMAGCLPEYMPVLVAAVKAMEAPEFNLFGIQVSANPVAVMAVINGPIRMKIKLNCTRGCLGPGWQANATIGRAIRLILINLGGGVPELVAKAIHGSPGKYTFCFGEDEEGSPWQPLHVERGFPAGASTVTLVAAQATHNNICIAPDGPTFLKLAADAMSTLGNNNMMLGGKGEPVVLLTSAHADILKQQGFSKADTKKFIWENAGRPLAEYPPKQRIAGYDFLIVNGKVMPCAKPEDIMIIIAGAPNPYHFPVMPTFGSTRAVTREIVKPVH